ncbi:hypothetical protein Sfulv_42980 [Streptomyces fulvorobeus]|uniref:Uncharacterized protein n=1 Tax=Streptomyces fulvorobeus TaxID=284028 RepID=A0A7J0CBB1_9ACTN|nr:hypothetical protein Sfulv_42980 [Streptomyces fulvorobeus]
MSVGRTPRARGTAHTHVRSGGPDEFERAAGAPRGTRRPLELAPLTPDQPGSRLLQAPWVDATPFTDWEPMIAAGRLGFPALRDSDPSAQIVMELLDQSFSSHRARPQGRVRHGLNGGSRHQNVTREAHGRR